VSRAAPAGAPPLRKGLEGAVGRHRRQVAHQPGPPRRIGMAMASTATPGFKPSAAANNSKTHTQRDNCVNESRHRLSSLDGTT